MIFLKRSRKELPQPEKIIYKKKFKANIILNLERLNAVTLKLGTRQECLLLSLYAIFWYRLEPMK